MFCKKLVNVTQNSIIQEFHFGGFTGNHSCEYLKPWLSLILQIATRFVAATFLFFYFITCYYILLHMTKIVASKEKRMTQC